MSSLLLSTFLSLFLLLATLLSFSAADFITSCPKKCRCKWTGGKATADCSSKDLTTVPRGVSPEVQVLNLNGNLIKELEMDVFKMAGLVNLQKISITNCGIEKVHETAFRFLPMLMEIDLSHNNISKIARNTFQGNRNLIEIDLSSNRLTTMEDAVIIGLAILKSLVLRDNPWVCDCKLKKFRDYVVLHGLYNVATECSEPEKLAGKPWNSNLIGSNDFACNNSRVDSQPGTNAQIPDVKPGHHFIKEYHIHVYFKQHNKDEVNAALEIRDAVVKEVRAGNLTVVCNGVTSDILPGIIDDEVYDFNMEPIGPHPVGSFEIWVPQEQLAEALSFVLLRRGSLSLLLHPLGRTELEDHTTHATFFGPSYGLDLSVLSTMGGDDPQYVGLGLGYSKK